jgi:predicted DNA-binding protein (UPF0251 family)
MAKRNNRLSDKQLKALELLTCGKGLTYTQIAEEVGVRRETLWRWLNEQQFATFQEEHKRLNDERWMCLVDVARASAQRLVEKDNQRMVEFILKNEGYNPTQKVEADLHTDIVINIDEE